MYQRFTGVWLATQTPVRNFPPEKISDIEAIADFVESNFPASENIAKLAIVSELIQANLWLNSRDWQ